MTIKNFSDLTFKPHANVNKGVEAMFDLGNGLEISAVSMKKREGEYGGLYGDVTKGTYEVAVFHKKDMLPLGAFDDVIGWQTEDEVTELMAELQGDASDIDGFIQQMHEHRKSERADLDLD
jgi:hypothetical protein